MQLVCEDRLHKSQVGAVGSSLGSYPRGRQFESGTLQHSFSLIPLTDHEFL